MQISPERRLELNAKERARRQADPVAYRESDARRNTSERRKAWKAEYMQRPDVKARAAASQRERRAKNPSAHEAAWAKWRENHPEEYAAKRQRQDNRRLALKHAVENTLTREQWNAIKRAYGDKCAYCGKHSLRLTQDHVIPISAGGGTVAANIVPACRPCNSRKCNRDAPTVPAVRLLL